MSVEIPLPNGLVLPPRENIHVIKTPKGMYIRTNNGKIYAVRHNMNNNCASLAPNTALGSAGLQNADSNPFSGMPYSSGLVSPCIDLSSTTRMPFDMSATPSTDMYSSRIPQLNLYSGLPPQSTNLALNGDLCSTRMQYGNAALARNTDLCSQGIPGSSRLPVQPRWATPTRVLPSLNYSSMPCEFFKIYIFTFSITAVCRQVARPHTPSMSDPLSHCGEGV